MQQPSIGLLPRTPTISSLRNDLPYCLKTSDVAIYADNTTIYYSSPSMNDINTAINADFEALRGWLEGNKLSLNVVKTQGMIMGSSRWKLHSIDLPSSSKPDLNIGGEEITMVNNTKYLGLQVDDQLNGLPICPLQSRKSLEVSVC